MISSYFWSDQITIGSGDDKMSDTIFIGLVDPLLQKVDFKNLSAVE